MPSYITVSQSDYANLSIPINTESDVLLCRPQIFEIDLKEIKDRIDILEQEVCKLKQQLRGDIKL